MPDHIPNMMLSTADLPTAADADRTAVSEFALGFHAYDVWGNLRIVQELTYAAKRGWTRDGGLPQSLTLLRTALFGEARLEYHAGEDHIETDSLRGYRAALLAAIKLLIADGAVGDEHHDALNWLRDNTPLVDDAGPPYDGETPLREDDVRDAVAIAARLLTGDHEPGTPITEAHLRDDLALALAHVTGATVDRERRVIVPGFQGVGPIDIVVRAAPNDSPIGLIECKLSRDDHRDKIYEGVWDAIKLALAVEVLPAASGYLVIGAAPDAWATSETADLFEEGSLGTVALLDRPLTPHGPNGGATVGEDLLAGGYGNVFQRAPAMIKTAAIGRCPVDDRPEEIRAIRVRGAGELLTFAEAPEFPERIDQTWLDAHVPGMDTDQFDRLLARLRAKRWSSDEIETRVLPLSRWRP